MHMTINYNIFRRKGENTDFESTHTRTVMLATKVHLGFYNFKSVRNLQRSW